MGEGREGGGSPAPSEHCRKQVIAIMLFETAKDATYLLVGTAVTTSSAGIIAHFIADL